MFQTLISRVIMIWKWEIGFQQIEARPVPLYYVRYLNLRDCHAQGGRITFIPT